MRSDVATTKGFNIHNALNQNTFDADNVSPINEGGANNGGNIANILGEAATTRNNRTSCAFHNCLVEPDPASCNNNPPPPGGGGGDVAAPIVMPSFTASMTMMGQLKYYNVLKDDLGNNNFGPTVSPGGAPAGTSEFYNYLVTGTIDANADCPINEAMATLQNMTFRRQIHLHIIMKFHSKSLMLMKSTFSGSLMETRS